MSFFDAYKPFRNFMRDFEMVESLIDVWHYALLVDHRIDLPPSHKAGRHPILSLNDAPYPWEIDALAREVVLNAGRHPVRRLRNWPEMAKTINHIRRLDDASFTACAGEPDVLIDLHRIIHRQFPAQTGVGVNPMMRAHKVFGDDAIQHLVEAEFGITAHQYMLLGIAVSGHFLKKPVLSLEKDYSSIEIPAEAHRAFFDRITTTLPQLRAETMKRQAYDNGWPYAWNPLEGKPLIRFDPAQPHLVICPIPRYLLQRTSAGLFYDLINRSNFDNAFGRSFQNYVGEVIAATCPRPRFRAASEEPYYVGQNLKHGVDWILSDDTGHIFIEAKTKRLTLNARTLTDTKDLHADLRTMAAAIVQHYQNIRDAMAGKTKWVGDGLPIYPVVLTLEDWFAFTPHVDEALQGYIRGKLAEHEIPESILDEMPYVIASAHEFEIVAQVIGKAGIAPVMSYNLTPGARNWSMLPAVRQGFPNEMRKVNWRLFGEEFLAQSPAPPSIPVDLPA